MKKEKEGTPNWKKKLKNGSRKKEESLRCLSGKFFIEMMTHVSEKLPLLDS